jgi:DNA (cytosine-5)-methyltransferase 1
LDIIFFIDEPCSIIRSVKCFAHGNYVVYPADKVSDLSKVRPLAAKERNYMQTFPKSFEFVESHDAIELVIGDAVPMRMAEYMGKINGICRLAETRAI